MNKYDKMIEENQRKSKEKIGLAQHAMGNLNLVIRKANRM